MANSLWTTDHTKLRDTLAGLYLDKESAQRIAVEAGINPTLVKFSDSAANNWHAIIREADAQGMLMLLIERAISEHPTNQALNEVHSALEAGRAVPKPELAPAETLPPISDLQLRDFIYIYFDKRDIGEVLLQVTGALQQAGKIPINTNIDIDTFSSTSEPIGSIVLEMVKYFRRRMWTSFLIAAVKEARPDAFREKFGG